MMDHDYGYHGSGNKTHSYSRELKEGQASLFHLPGGYNHCSPGTRSEADDKKKWIESNDELADRDVFRRPSSFIETSSLNKEAAENLSSSLLTKGIKPLISSGLTENNRSRSGTMKGAPKQSQISATLKWLTENYERSEGVCLPRCVLYTHYLDFCKKQNFCPAGAATFGKIIRQKFPKLTTRRLGTRGQSKYHYYGIGIKESSIYYHSVYTGKGLTRFSGSKVKTEGSSRKYSLSSKTGTLLPEFPDAQNLVLPDGVEKDKVQTFIMMYRTHCQRILDTIISANFDEVQSFLIHFWQGMPEHLVELLQYDLITDLVGLCDSILYKVLVDVLIPSTIQDLPDSLSSEIRVFVKKLAMWLDSSLEGVPQTLRDKKLQVVKTFGQSVKRQMSFVHLAQTARGVIMCSDTVTSMLEDMGKVDFNRVCEQACFTNPALTEKHIIAIADYFKEFHFLLKKQAAIESFTEWADTVIDHFVLEKKTTKEFSEMAAQFLLQWTIVCSLVMRDLTLCSAPTFGSFHLLHMMLDEYMFLVMETRHNQDKENVLQKAMRKHLKVDEVIHTEAKVRTSVPKSNGSPKAKKRKISLDSEETDGDVDPRLGKAEHLTKSDELPPPHPYDSSSSLARAQSGYRDPAEYPGYPSDNPRSAFNPAPGACYPAVPTTIRHYSPMHGNTFERTPYFSHLSINTYPEYMSQPPAAIASPRVSAAGDAAPHVQSYPPGPLSGSGISVGSTGSPPYWNDARSHPASFPDPYSAYPGYSKYSAAASYDSYNRTGGFLRGGTYQESFSRSAFESPRSLYGRPHDRALTAGGGLPYGGAYMDISHHPASCPQYPRQEMVLPHPQDDFYPSNMSNTLPLAKAYVPPFR